MRTHAPLSLLLGAIALAALLTACPPPDGGSAPSATPSPTATPNPSASTDPVPVVPEENHPPTVDAGSDISATTGTAVSLHAAISDPDGDVLFRTWSFVSVPAGSSLTDDSIDGSLTEDASFTPDVDGVYTLEIAVTDLAAVSADRVQVTAVAPAYRPVGAINVSPSVCLPDTAVSFSGVALDYGQSGMRFSLAFVSQPAGSSLSFAEDSATYRSYQGMAPQELALHEPGEYRVRFTATNGYGGSMSDDALIRVMAANPDGNTAPVAYAGEDITAAQSAGVQLGLDGKQSGDVDGDHLTYLWSFVSGPAMLEGNFTGLAGALQYPTQSATELSALLPAGDYTLRLTVDDGRGFGTSGSGSNQASIVSDDVNVTIVDQAPYIYGFFADRSTVYAEDPAADKLITIVYGIFDGDVAYTPANAVVSIVQAPADSTAALSAGPVAPLASFGSSAVETEFTPDLPGEYRFRLTVTDGTGTQTREISIQAISNAQGGAHVTVN